MKIENINSNNICLRYHKTILTAQERLIVKISQHYRIAYSLDNIDFFLSH